MTEQDLFLRLYELSESDADGLRKLAEEIGRQCGAPAETVLTEWISGPPNRQTPCAFICSHLKELAVAAMFHQTDSVAPALRVHLMEMVATQQLAFRELLLTALEPLLRDLTPAGTSASGDELRTCDAAYLLVRRIVRLSASAAGHFSAEEQFTALGLIERDSEINQWLLSETWKEILPEPPER
jgi:hypothetical protein